MWIIQRSWSQLLENFYSTARTLLLALATERRSSSHVETWTLRLFNCSQSQRTRDRRRTGHCTWRKGSFLGDKLVNKWRAESTKVFLREQKRKKQQKRKRCIRWHVCWVSLFVLCLPLTRKMEGKIRTERLNHQCQ